ncbi:MAG TPA: peptidyl-prolyl cis-trans isomerase [Thermoanaerobaculia bacterium]
MRRSLPSLALSLLLALPCAMVPSGVRADTLNKVVLRVNDQISTLYDYNRRREDFVRDLTRREMDSEERSRALAQAPEMVFRDMFQDLLLESRAHQLAIEVTDAQLAGALAQMKQNFGIKTDEEFQAALAQSGMTEAQLRDQIKNQLRVREVMDREVRTRVKVDEEDLRRYYRKNLEQFRLPEQFHLKEVVVLDDGGLPSAADRSALAARIRQAVVAGKPLAEAVAEDQKKGSTSAEIDLGWVSSGDLDPALQAAAWKLKPSEVTEPVAGRGGIHLIVAAEHRDSRIPPFSEVQSVIQSREQDRVYNQEVTKYMAELEQKSLIVVDPPTEAAGFRRLLSKPEPAEPQIPELTPPAPLAAPALSAAQKAGKDKTAPPPVKPGMEPVKPATPEAGTPQPAVQPPPPGV